jgi:replicative DNA helicase
METPLTLPCSEDGEKGLLSSLLQAGDAVAIEIKVPPQAFYIPAHRLLWAVAYRLIAEKKPLDFVLLKERLIVLGKLEEVGVEYLSSLYNFVPTWANFRHYADIVLDNWRVRKAILGIREVMQRLENRGEDGWAQLKGPIENCLLRLVSDDDEVDTKEMTMAWMEDLSTRKERLARGASDLAFRRSMKRLVNTSRAS